MSLLEVLVKRDDISILYGWLSQSLCPPFLELCVYLHIERVFGWWGFGESVSYIYAESDVVESCYACPYQSMCQLLNACSVGLGYGDNFSMTGASVACAS